MWFSVMKCSNDDTERNDCKHVRTFLTTYLQIGYLDHIILEVITADVTDDHTDGATAGNFNNDNDYETSSWRGYLKSKQIVTKILGNDCIP